MRNQLWILTGLCEKHAKKYGRKTVRPSDRIASTNADAFGARIGLIDAPMELYYNQVRFIFVELGISQSEGSGCGGAATA